MTASPGSTYTNDLAGNRTQKTTGTFIEKYFWDSLNRMTKFTAQTGFIVPTPDTQTYLYRPGDGEGNRRLEQLEGAFATFGDGAGKFLGATALARGAMRGPVQIKGSAARDLVNEGVYVVTTEAGKVYVGQSKNISGRLMRHVRDNKFSLGDIASVKRYGLSGVTRRQREVLETKVLQGFGGPGGATLNMKWPVAKKHWDKLGIEP